MFAQEPHLQLVGPEQLAHKEIIRAVIPKLGGAMRKLPRFTNHHLVRIEQARQLNRHAFAAARRSIWVVSATSAAMARLTPPKS